MKKVPLELDRITDVSPAKRTYTPLTGAAVDTLYKLGAKYPKAVEDGDLPSKVGRDELMREGLARYDNGNNYLTTVGFSFYLRRKQEHTNAGYSADEVS